jgi:hypothetical protein
VVREKKGAAAPDKSGQDDGGGTTGPTEPGQAPGESSAVIEPGEGELQGAVESLGEAIREREGATGGYDISEAGHQTALERMEALGDDLQLNSRSLIAGVRDFLVDVIKSRPKPWGATSPGEQRDVASACEQLATGLVREVLELIRADGKASVRVLLTKVTLGDDIQITGKAKPMGEEEEDKAVQMLHHARGKHVLLTVASADDYRQEHPEAQTDVEEPVLPFEAGGQEVSDEDLRADHLEVGDATEATLRTGDTVDVDQHGEVTVRIDLSTGMVTGLTDGDEYVDIREATPAELAAERDRVADFGADEEEDDSSPA